MTISRIMLLASTITIASAISANQSVHIIQCDQELIKTYTQLANEDAQKAFDSFTSRKPLMKKSDFIDSCYMEIKKELKRNKKTLKALAEKNKEIKTELKKEAKRLNTVEAIAAYDQANAEYKESKANYAVFKSGPYENLKKEWLNTIKIFAQQPQA